MNISITQALGVVHDLYQALEGEASHGDTAEIYLHRLMPMSFGYVNRGKLNEEHYRKMDYDAANSLYWLCDWFCKRNECQIEIDGIPYGEWMGAAEMESHRVKVRVIRADPED